MKKKAISFILLLAVLVLTCGGNVVIQSNAAVAEQSVSIIKCDVDKNGITDILDLSVVAKNYGKTSADSDWEQLMEADVNADSQIDIRDLASVAKLFGRDLSSYLTPVIDILPGSEVAVNQEVFFTGDNSTFNGTRADNSSTDVIALGRGIYSWDFGDGYSMKFVKSDEKNGMNVTHYYMKPGTFMVTLNITMYDKYADGFGIGEPIAQATVTKQITVTGIEPLDGYELLHAPLTNRIAQFITPLIPDSVKSDSTNKLVVTLTGDNETNQTLFDEGNLSEEKQFLLEQGKLAKGTYTLTGKLLDKDGNIIKDGEKEGLWVETFTKAYDGIPKVGINEWNAICVNGEPYFPVTPFMLNAEDFPLYEGQLNTAYNVGWYKSAPYHTAEDIADYLDKCAISNLKFISPGRGIMYAGRKASNLNIVEIQKVIQATMNHDALLMYEWDDEPNLGGRAAFVYPPTLSAYKYVADQLDGQHPTMVNLYGFNWLPYYGITDKGSRFDAAGSTRYNDRHTFYADVITSDIYPNFARLHPSMKNKEQGPVELWTIAFDKLNQLNYGLVPFGVFIEVGNVRSYAEETIIPSIAPEELLMEGWLAITHGAKMINCFQHFRRNEVKHDAMKELMTGINTYYKIILSPDNIEQISDDSNVRTNRVDSMTRKDGTDTYLFAVRLTEFDPLEGETINALPENIEPESITTTFSVPGMNNGTATVLDENGAVVRTIDIVNGKFTDTFEKFAYRIYRIK